MNLARLYATNSLMVAIMVSAVPAQERQGSSDAAGAGNDEIIITARKRAQPCSAPSTSMHISPLASGW
jgi:hypothetical protein